MTFVAAASVNKYVLEMGNVTVRPGDAPVETIKEFIYYDDLKRIFIIKGEKIEAKTVLEILKI